MVDVSDYKLFLYSFKEIMITMVLTKLFSFENEA